MPLGRGLRSVFTGMKISHLTQPRQTSSVNLFENGESWDWGSRLGCVRPRLDGSFRLEWMNEVCDCHRRDIAGGQGYWSRCLEDSYGGGVCRLTGEAEAL